MATETEANGTEGRRSRAINPDLKAANDIITKLQGLGSRAKREFVLSTVCAYFDAEDEEEEQRRQATTAPAEAGEPLDFQIAPHAPEAGKGD